MKIIQCYRICGNSFFFHLIGMNIFERNIRLFEKKVRRIRSLFNPIEHYYKQYRRLFHRIKTFSVFNFICVLLKQNLGSLSIF